MVPQLICRAPLAQLEQGRVDARRGTVTFKKAAPALGFRPSPCHPPKNYWKTAMFAAPPEVDDPVLIYTSA